MNKTFNIYCDESTHMVHDGHPYMLLGCTSIAYTQIRMAKDAIKDIKKKHGYSDELKWTNVHEATYKVYAELIDWFFMNDMEFRAVVVDKSQIDEKREDYTFNDFYFRMYYQLLHHKMDMDYTYNIYMDIKDTCSSDKLERLKKNNGIQLFHWQVSVYTFTRKCLHPIGRCSNGSHQLQP